MATRLRVANDPKTGKMAVMEQPIYEYVMGQLEARRGQWPKVSRETGVPYRTLQKVATREIADPGVSTIQTLADYFHEEAAKAA